jgi:hypothetical protein
LNEVFSYDLFSIRLSAIGSPTKFKDGRLQEAAGGAT